MLKVDWHTLDGVFPEMAKLHDYIRDCAAVVCVVGRRSGAAPPEAAARPFAHLLPAALGSASYTQWEFFFARGHGKRSPRRLGTGHGLHRTGALDRAMAHEEYTRIPGVPRSRGGNTKMKGACYVRIADPSDPRSIAALGEHDAEGLRQRVVGRADDPGDVGLLGEGMLEPCERTCLLGHAAALDDDGRAELVGERKESRCLSLRVVKQQYLGHQGIPSTLEDLETTRT
jgi:hypothetical protein